MAALPLAAVLAYPELAHAASELQEVILTVGDKEVSEALIGYIALAVDLSGGKARKNQRMRWL